MNKGKLRKMFPGGNTYKGFHSFYNFIIEPDATRIFCIKGGPGVGKSTFMRWIGEQMIDRGYDLEFHCCSSDNGSLDGIVIPAIRVAMLDGTAPHVVDPKNPGIVDEIIHLGDYWNEKKMRVSKEDVLQLNAKVGRLFGLAYNNLREAKVAYDEWESYINESMDVSKVRKSINEISAEIFTQVIPQYDKMPRVRKLFATAITPTGPINHLDTILQGTEKLYILKGDPGSGVCDLISTVSSTATSNGLDTEVYHCSLNPDRLDSVIIPELKVAVINGSEPLDFNPNSINSLTIIKNIDLNQFVKNNVLNIYKEEMLSAKDRFWSGFNRAVQFINRAKTTHDEMENYYIPNMDFDAINVKRAEILQRILHYAEEFK